jgi:hypothetical protein
MILKLVECSWVVSSYPTLKMFERTDDSQVHTLRSSASVSRSNWILMQPDIKNCQPRPKNESITRSEYVPSETIATSSLFFV